MTKAILLVAALLLVASPAAAHVTVTVDPLQAPLVVGVPTNVTVHFSEPCFEVAPQELQGQDTVSPGLTADAVTTIGWAGEAVPFTTDMCDPTAVPLALVATTATLTLTASAQAPGLTNLTVPVAAFLGDSTEPGESVVDLPFTIAYYANGTLHAMPGTAVDGMDDVDHDAMAHDANASAATGPVPLMLHVTYTTNAASILTFEATASTGQVMGLGPLNVTPPSFDNKTTLTATALPTFMPPADWSEADLAFTAYLAPAAGGEKVKVASATLHLSNDVPAMDGMEHDDHTHTDEDSSAIPAPTFAVVAIGLLALAVTRRK